LTLLGRDGDWYQVALPKGEAVWLHSGQGRVDVERPQLEVIPKVVRIRESNDPSSPVVAKAAKGLILGFVQEQTGWYQVKLPHQDGPEGWVRSDLVAVKAAPGAPSTGVRQVSQYRQAGLPSARTFSNFSSVDAFLQNMSAGTVLVLSIVAGFSVFIFVLIIGSVFFGYKGSSVYGSTGGRLQGRAYR